MKLDAPHGATEEQLHASFRRLAKRCHPDAHPDRREWATREFQELQQDLSYRLRFKVEVVKPKPRAPSPPPPPTTPKSQVVTAIIGTNAFYNSYDKKVLIRAVVKDGVKKLSINLFTDEWSPGKVYDKSFSDFLFQVPLPDHEWDDYHIIHVANLPFRCDIELKHEYLTPKPKRR